MTRAKEGSRTPTPVKALEPESVARDAYGSVTVSESVAPAYIVSPLEAAADRCTRRNSGSVRPNWGAS